ncbi:phage holin family protein [Cupriavidus sp. DB3]|uniref:HP1 family phage holin n=1 Tax=Cupriavidus sp. DB3 TaxID=2873259 RepID=UPI001CF1C620|nr:HP1 family phage holin [Cupriavidus sp. DB3]MCA7083377.1 phage holin family protein [Cupriavidus sp. DB3]
MRQLHPVEATSYAGAITSIGASLTLADIGVIVGIVTALLTFGLNAWYTRLKYKLEAQERAARDEREREEHAARMRVLEARDEP